MDSAFPNVPFYLRYDTLSLYLEAAGIVPVVFLYKENPALDAGFRERYAFDQKSSES